MSAPGQRVPDGPGSPAILPLPSLSRRGFGSIVGGAVAAAASPVFGRSPSIQVPGPKVTCGVAARATWPDGSAVVWSRSDRPAKMRVEWATNDALRDSRRRLTARLTQRRRTTSPRRPSSYRTCLRARRSSTESPSSTPTRPRLRASPSWDGSEPLRHDQALADPVRMGRATWRARAGGSTRRRGGHGHRSTPSARLEPGLLRPFRRPRLRR